MLFKYKLKNRWYSADIPKEDYDKFLNMTFADKMKYIKNMDTKNEIETSDLGYSVLGTKKEKLKSETFEQLQDKEQKRTLAKNKISELKKVEDKINDIINQIESKPDDTSDETKLKELEKLLEQKELLVHQIQTLNVDNISLMDVKHVDTLNIKGINKLVSDINSNNITETFNKLKDMMETTLSDFTEKNVSDEIQKVMNIYQNNINSLLGSDDSNKLTPDDKVFISLINTIAELMRKMRGKKTLNSKYPKQIFEKNFYYPLYTFTEQTELLLNINMLYNYNHNASKKVSVLNIMSWRSSGDYNKITDMGEIYKFSDTVFVIPINENKPQLKEELKNVIDNLNQNNMNDELRKLKASLETIGRELTSFYNNIDEDVENINIMLDIIKTLKESVKIIKDIPKQQNDDDDGEGEGIISDIKNAPKKIKMATERLSNLENKIESLEQMIKEMKLKDVATPVVVENVKEDNKETKTEPNNVFKIPPLKHVEPVKREPEDEFKDLKDILNKRRQDIEYSDDIDDVSEDPWSDDDSYTELTAGSLQDATELIESLRDNYNIVLRMYINKKAKK